MQQKRKNCEWNKDKENYNLFVLIKIVEISVYAVSILNVEEKNSPFRLTHVWNIFVYKYLLRSNIWNTLSLSYYLYHSRHRPVAFQHYCCCHTLFFINLCVCVWVLRIYSSTAYVQYREEGNKFIEICIASRLWIAYTNNNTDERSVYKGKTFSSDCDVIEQHWECDREKDHT